MHVGDQGLDPCSGDASTRRAFVRQGIRRVAYIAPAVLVLERQTDAAFGASCLPQNSPCTVDSECCSNNCVVMMGEGVCKM